VDPETPLIAIVHAINGKNEQAYRSTKGASMREQLSSNAPGEGWEFVLDYDHLTGILTGMKMAAPLFRPHLQIEFRT